MAKHSQKPRKRDYSAEYRKRIERGLKRGLSRSQSRGHARASEQPLRQPPARTIPDEALEEALKSLRKTNNQARAAREAGISVERFRRFLRSGDLANFQGRAWTFSDNRPRDVLIYSNGRQLTIKVPGFDAASKAGAYAHAVGEFLETNDAEHLAPFEGESLTDLRGTSHPLETDPNTLYRLSLSGTDRFEDAYKISN